MPNPKLIHTLVTGAVLIAASHPLHANTVNNPLIQQLVEQARFWERKGKDDLASNAWQRVLRADPNNIQALAQLAIIENRAGRPAEAEAHIAAIRKLDPRAAVLNEIKSQSITTSKAKVIDQARKSASTGNTQGAVEKYREALGETKPSGNLGLEYLLTLSGTAGGWEEARRGLEDLVKNNPNDTRYRLGLAQILTYREASRREGIRQLAMLAKSGSAGPDVAKAWRQALTWLGGSKFDLELYREYLQVFPDDQSVRSRLTQQTKSRKPYRPSPLEIARNAGFSEIKDGNLEAAEQRFQGLLARNQKDADAWGGLGLIALRKDQFDLAIDHLQKAAKLKRREWTKPLNTARYWAMLQDVLDAQASGQLADKALQLQQALALEPDEPTGLALKANLLEEMNRLAQAEEIYRKLIQTHPETALAYQGLMRLFVAQGRTEEAEAFYAQLASDKKLDDEQLLDLRTSLQLLKARAARRAGQHDLAIEYLEDALLTTPDDPWVKLELLGTYQESGEKGAALSLLNDLLQSNPTQPEALSAQARLFASENRWLEALQVLESIPKDKRRSSVVKEQNLYWMSFQASRAVNLHQSGKSREAKRILSETEKLAGTRTDALIQVAEAWDAVGDQARALKILRKLLSSGQIKDPGPRLAYAAMLLRSGLSAEARATIRALSQSADQLNDAQYKALNNLIIALTVQQADAWRESGKLSQANEALIAALQETDDPRLVMALARVLNTSGAPLKALELAEDVIHSEPDDVDHRLFAVGMALSGRDLNAAQNHIQRALELSPDSPRVLAMAGKVEKALGNTSTAIHYFRLAQAREGDAASASNWKLGPQQDLELQILEVTPNRDRSSASKRLQSLQPKRSTLLPLPLEQTASTRQRPSGLAPLPRLEAADEDFEREVAPLRPIQPRVAPTRRIRAEEARLFEENVQQSNLEYDNYPEQARRSARPYQAQLPARFTQRNVARTTSEPSIQDELRELESASSPTADFALGMRNKSGSEGTSRLFTTESMLGASYTIDPDTKISFRITPTFLDSGSLSLATPGDASKFGSIAAGSFLTTPSLFPSSRKESASGAGLALAFDHGSISADLGVSQFGFAVQNAVGGVSWTTGTDRLTIRTSAVRRAVTDSVLSYAGTTDPRTGEAWGGVVKTGLKFDMTLGDDKAGTYINLAGYQLTGKEVATNHAVDLAVGGYWRVINGENLRLTTGITGSFAHYQKNLSHFTLGHGGYFSPQQYASLSLPIELTGKANQLTYQIGGDFGMRRICQDSALYFPNSNDMQNSWEKLITSVSGIAGLSSSYASSCHSGLGYRFLGALEYRLFDDTAVGGQFIFQNSKNYSEQQGMIYIHHAFDGLPKATLTAPKIPFLFNQGARE